MAWNAWNTFSVDGKPLRGGRKEYESIAEAMIESGMRDAGYTLISTVCTGWVGRDPVTHRLQENLTAWPGGMKSFADYLHGRGMQLSVYTDAGEKNCCGEPGSLGFEALDTATFAAWGADAVGVDYCGGPTDVQGAYARFADGIVRSGRDMQLEIWNLGRGAAQTWAPSLSRNMTAASPGHSAFVPHIRLTADIGNAWSGRIGPTESLVDTVDEIQRIADLWSYGMGNTSGTFPNYGQMLVGVPRDHPTRGDPGLTPTEAQSHFSLWCMFPTILMATNDVRLRDPAVERILLNHEAIAINQDPWASPAARIATPQGCGGEQWARALSNGDSVVLVLNRDDAATVHTRVDFAALRPATAAAAGASAATGSTPAQAYSVRDVQANSDLGIACGHVNITLAPHQTAFLRLARVPVPVPGGCAPPPTAQCTPPSPAPAPTPAPAPGPLCPGWPNRAAERPCQPCRDPAAPCGFPVPPLPPCPAGFSTHASGYWSRPDQPDRQLRNTSVAACAARCAANASCVGFEVYDPMEVTLPAEEGGSCCYTAGADAGAFVPDRRGLIRTCLKVSPLKG
eukprot:g4905.t1